MRQGMVGLMEWRTWYADSCSDGSSGGCWCERTMMEKRMEKKRVRVGNRGNRAIGE